MKWSTKNDLAQKVCEEISFIPSIEFVEAALGNDGLVYVRGTCGHPEHFSALEAACLERGFVYLSGRENVTKGQVRAWANHVEDKENRREAKKYGYSVPELDSVVVDRISLLGQQKAVQIAAKKRLDFERSH
jgi:hypothetical protein